MESSHTAQRHAAWNKGKLVGQKTPFKLKEIWAIRIRLQMQERLRELALFDLGIDSKLRACDLVGLRVTDSRFVSLLGECCFDGRQECSQLGSEQRRSYPCELPLHSLIGTVLQRPDKGAASRNKERRPG